LYIYVAVGKTWPPVTGPSKTDNRIFSRRAVNVREANAMFVTNLSVSGSHGVAALVAGSTAARLLLATPPIAEKYPAT
jgi:hypothetical protein